jgi:hypothetical protein
MRAFGGRAKVHVSSRPRRKGLVVLKYGVASGRPFLLRDVPARVELRNYGNYGDTTVFTLFLFRDGALFARFAAAFARRQRAASDQPNGLSAQVLGLGLRTRRRRSASERRIYRDVVK